MTRLLLDGRRPVLVVRHDSVCVLTWCCEEADIRRTEDDGMIERVWLAWSVESTGFNAAGKTSPLFQCYACSKIRIGAHLVRSAGVAMCARTYTHVERSRAGGSECLSGPGRRLTRDRGCGLIVRCKSWIDAVVHCGTSAETKCVGAKRGPAAAVDPFGSRISHTTLLCLSSLLMSRRESRSLSRSLVIGERRGGGAKRRGKEGGYVACTSAPRIGSANSNSTIID